MKECSTYFLEHARLEDGGAGDTGTKKVDELLKEVCQKIVDLRGEVKVLAKLKGCCSQ